MSTIETAAGGGQTPATDQSAGLEKAMAELNAVLIPGERIEATAIQRRLFALTHRRVIVVATSGRFIAMSRGLFGGFKLQDVRWQDLKDVQLRAGVFGSNLIIYAMASQDLAVQEVPAGGLVLAGLRKADAETVYRVCQANEQAWREKRRQRELEEMRAKAGGVQIGSPAAAAMGTSDEDPTERLQRAREMLTKGLISDSEYEAIKARVLGTL